MELQTKALYNLLRLNAEHDPTFSCEAWQIENMRVLSSESLFERLQNLGLILDDKRFHSYGSEADSPEELTELLVEEEADQRVHDHIYLLLFELWRRRFPEKQTLSIFCDELDHQMDLYESSELVSDESLQDALANLVDILDEHVDEGADPKKIFVRINQYCANDLVQFLFDYISDLLDTDSLLYASELIDDFEPYLSGLPWMEFLTIRLLALSDPIAANVQMAKLLKKKEMPLGLLIELLRFQVTYGEKELFFALLQSMAPLIKTSEELHEVLELSAEYFRRRDREDLEQSVLRLAQKNKCCFDPSHFEQLIDLLKPLSS